MIKVLSLIKRRPDISRPEFRQHYESVHAPLALPLMTGLERYVRYHLEEVLTGDVIFDVLSAFWYRDAESTKQMMTALQGEAGKAILSDELSFMDKPANCFFPVSETILETPSEKQEEGDDSVFVLAKRPAELSRFDASVRLLRTEWPKLILAMGSVEFALARDAFAMDNADREAAWSGILQVRGPEIPGLESWARRLRSEGFLVSAVRTRRFETDLLNR